MDPGSLDGSSRKSNMSLFFGGTVMLRHYLRFAVRGLARQKLHASLAVAVLTLGLTCFLGALAPNAPSGSPQFLDQAFAAAYSTFDRVSRVVTILAAFATAIAAVGLFGMASFLADRRTREIGLRKTQGATTRGILRLLLADFSRPVLIANIAIWPLAYVAARAYVNLFVERMPITPWPFLATLAATLLLAWLVIGARVVRASRVSPTVALRHE